MGPTEPVRAARTVTFVVHGVGSHKTDSAEVDAATRDFAETWGRRNRVPLSRTDHVAHPDLGPSTAYAIFHGRLDGGREHRIVELQWADLSRGRGGFLAPVVELLRVIFGLRHVAVATESPGEDRVLAATGWLSRLIFGILRGPILAWNAVMAAGLLFVSAWAPNPLSSSAAMVVIGALGCLPCLLVPRLRRNWVVRWSLVGGLVATSIPWWPACWLFTLRGLDSMPRGRPSFVTYVYTFGLFLNVFWLIVALCSVFLIAAWLLGRWRMHAGARQSFDARVWLTALAIRIWSFGIPLVWTSIHKLSKESLVAHGSAAAILQVKEVQQLENAFIPLLGVNWLLLFTIGGVALASYVVFASRTSAEPRSRAEPRLVISTGLMWVVILTTLMASTVMLIFLAWALRHMAGAAGGLHVAPSSPPYAVFIWLYNSAWFLAAALAAAAFAFREKLKAGCDFALDVTNYFRGNGPRSFRTLVQSRFASIVGDVMRSGADQVVFISHSQGTVLTAEYLHGSQLPEGRLVTMGSPISHLYEHYFAPAFWLRGPPVVGRDVGEWLNLFRCGDFIGRSVVAAAENCSIGPGGHIGYFKDPRVHALLEERGLLPRRQPG
jgi:hypothetical protein